MTTTNPPPSANAAGGVWHKETGMSHELSESTINMAIARLGGMVDGQPTSRRNFLQRIDELRWIEEDRKNLQAEIARRDRYRMSCACFTGDCDHDTHGECLRDQAAAIEEQAAYIALLESKLGRTADGVVVGAGDRVYPAYTLADGLDPEEADDIDDHAKIVLAARCNESGELMVDGDEIIISSQYSTREAAAASRKAPQ